MLSVIAAMNLQGLQATMTFSGSLNRPLFEAWVERFLCPLLQPGERVILDNLSVHKSPKAIELIEERGAKVVFLPPYSPELNPIEMAWSKLKTLLRKWRPRSPQVLEEALLDAMDICSKHDFHAWIRHAGYSQ